MSRRRQTWPSREGIVRLSIECDGGKEGHPLCRIARVTVTPRPDLPTLNDGHAVDVFYVSEADDPEYYSRTQAGRGEGLGYHFTRVFPCRTCGRDKPLTDAHLVALALRLDAMGVRNIRLREIL